jgi:hypothetical protein
MNEFTAWMQNNWYALGNLLAQFAFLAAGVWFARKILKTIRASQEQVGALLKLSFTGAIGERPSSIAAEHRSFANAGANASPYWLMPEQKPPVDLTGSLENGPSHWAVARHRAMVWLQTPMSNGEAAPWRRAIRWLQAPARS